MEKVGLKEVREEMGLTMEELSEYSKIDLEVLKKFEEEGTDELSEEEKSLLINLILKLERFDLLNSKKNKTSNYKDELEKEIFEEVKSYKKSQIKSMVIKNGIIILVMLVSIFGFDKSLVLEKKQVLETETTLNNVIYLTEELKILNLELEKQQAKYNEEKLRKKLEVLEKKLIEEKMKVKNQEKDFTNNTNIISLIALLCALLVLILSKYDVLSDSIKTKEKIVERINVETLINELDKDFDNNMIKINIYQLNAYNDQTKLQANKSFKIASIASVVGFILLCIGLILVFFGENKPGYLTTGVGLLIEFLSGIIFYLYNKTIIKMGEYHKKIVLTQNIALALKATDDFEINKKMEIRGKIIEEILKDINKFLSEK